MLQGRLGGELLGVLTSGQTWKEGERGVAAVVVGGSAGVGGVPRPPPPRRRPLPLPRFSKRLLARAGRRQGVWTGGCLGWRKLLLRLVLVVVLLGLGLLREVNPILVREHCLGCCKRICSSKRTHSRLLREVRCCVRECVGACVFDSPYTYIRTFTRARRA